MNNLISDTGMTLNRIPAILENRILYSAISQIRVNDNAETEYPILLTSITNGGAGRKQFVRALHQLQHTELTYRRLDGSYVRTMLIGDSIIDPLYPGIIKITLPLPIIEAYSQKTHYTKVLVKHYMDFKSKYSFPIYDQCRRWMYRDNFDLYVSLLRCILIMPNCSMDVILRRAVKPALEDITRVTKIIYKLEYLKAGKKIVGIRIYPQKSISAFSQPIIGSITERERWLLLDSYLYKHTERRL